MGQVDERRDAERLEPRHPISASALALADREASGDKRLGDEVRLGVRKMAHLGNLSRRQEPK